MKHFFIFILLITNSLSFSQKNTNVLKITYSKASNGKIIDDQDPITVLSDFQKTMIGSENSLHKKASFPYEITFVERNSGNFIQTAQLTPNKTIYTIDSLSLKKQQFEFLPETKKILGLLCHKAKTVVNSNTIGIWYVKDANIKGGPTTLGQDLGLVLEVNRNNNFVITATKIETLQKFPSKIDLSNFKKNATDIATYRDELWKSRFTSISIFKDEIINFSEESKSNDSILRFAKGTLILKKVKIPKITAGSQVFIDLTEQSNGDAYDRTGAVFLIPTHKKISFLDGLQKGIKSLPAYESSNKKSYNGMICTENFSPLIELMRFFTPFGINKYNHIQLKNKTWEDKAYYRQEISELLTAFNDQEVYIGTFIGNYDKGGHTVSLNFTIHNDDSRIAKNNVILPLFNTTNVMEMAGQDYATLFGSEKGLEVTFTIEKELKNAQLRYITTGHGGWENGDEFVPKKNTITVDGKEIFSFVPWRTDCGSYRLYNPASGNFNNGLSSSDYSRSNWCPGTATNPNYIFIGDLKAGTHTISVKIPQGEPEGGSFSFWNVSGVLIAD